MFEGLAATRKTITAGLDNVLKNFTKIDEEFFDGLEETLIGADLGALTSERIIGDLREKVKLKRVTEVSEIRAMLAEELTDILTGGGGAGPEPDGPLKLRPPAIILVIGVNGVGKTTTIGKLAAYFKEQGLSVMLAAGDTFRAAAMEQLEIWGRRAGVPVIRHRENADPAAVIYDAIQSARARGADALICDTAGRLHNKKNLMEELKKIFRVVSQNYKEAAVEVLLVLDATTGQNALTQARLFKEAAGVTGIVLTKLDGTAKGGIVFAIKNELDVPVVFVGLGEGIHDLQPFDARAFSQAIFE